MTWQRAFPRAVLTAIALGLGLHMGRCAAERDNEPIIITQPDTVAASEYRKRWEQSEKENKGLRAKLEGIRELPAITRTVYDTIIKEITHTVYESVIIEGDRASTINLTPQDSGYVPIRDTFVLKNCDDKLAFERGRLVCDPARLGHLTLFARIGARTDLANGIPDLGATMHAGISWQPYYRSTTDIELYGDMQGRATLALSLGLRLF